MSNGVSVIMANYNKGEYLYAAAMSVLRQPTRVPFELIIVDDASTADEDAHMLKWLEQTAEMEGLPLSVCRLDENGGPCVARNVALSKAKYDYVLPVDSDDALNLDEVEQDSTFLDRASEILNVRSDMAYVYCGGSLIGACQGEWLPGGSVQAKQLVVSGNTPVNMMYRREDALAVGGYPLGFNFWEDRAFATMLLNHRVKQGVGLQTLKLPGNYYLYRQFDDGHNVNARNGQDFGSSCQEYFEKILHIAPEIHKHVFPHLRVSENLVQDMLHIHDRHLFRCAVRTAFRDPGYALSKADKGARLALRVAGDVFSRALNPR